MSAHSFDSTENAKRQPCRVYEFWTHQYYFYLHSIPFGENVWCAKKTRLGRILQAALLNHVSRVLFIGNIDFHKNWWIWNLARLSSFFSALSHFDSRPGRFSVSVPTSTSRRREKFWRVWESYHYFSGVGFTLWLYKTPQNIGLDSLDRRHRHCMIWVNQTERIQVGL